jgi:hypothetical protein
MISATIKGELLNPEWVISAARNARKPALARAGAYMRGIARRMVQFRRNKSLYAPAGGPPYTHTMALKDAIVFAVGENSVLIGPTSTGIGRIGHTHEFGGDEPAVAAREITANWRFVIGGHGPIDIRYGEVIYTRYRTEAQVQRGLELIFTQPRLNAPQSLWSMPDNTPQGLSLWRITTAKKNRHYPPRPFMGPALLVAQEKLPSLWANSIVRSA